MLTSVKNAYECLANHLSASSYKDTLKVQLQMLNALALRGIGNKSSLLSAADILAKLHDHLSNDIEYLIEYSQLKIELEDIDAADEVSKVIIKIY